MNNVISMESWKSARDEKLVQTIIEEIEATREVVMGLVDEGCELSDIQFDMIDDFIYYGMDEEEAEDITKLICGIE